MTDPCQYWNLQVDNYTMDLHNYIPTQLAILSSISKQFYKICQDRLKIVQNYVGENRVIPLLKKHNSFQMFEYFAQGGYLTLLKEAISRGYKWNDENMCKEAAYNGHLDVLKYCHESGCQFPQDIITASYNSLECLKYLHELDMEWSTECCANIASQSESLELLKYCHENGCKCTCFASSC